MTETITLPDGQVAESPPTPRPQSDGAARHAIDDATSHLKERAEKIRANPEAHLPKLILSKHVRGTANRAQAASDRRAIADHETLIALHEMARQQLDILNGQDRVLAMLDTFASKDMPGRQRDIQDCVDKILAKVDPAATAG